MWLFLDLCVSLNYSLFDYHNFRWMCYDVWEKRKDVLISEARDSEYLGKKIVTIVVCCLSCVKFLVNLFDVTGMKEKIFIECHRKHLHSNSSNSYNEFYFSDSDDTDFSDNDQENEELQINLDIHFVSQN